MVACKRQLIVFGGFHESARLVAGESGSLNPQKRQQNFSSNRNLGVYGRVILSRTGTELDFCVKRTRDLDFKSSGVGAMIVALKQLPILVAKAQPRTFGL